jgi:tetratricopeptide (TPR) repeat protein
MATNMKSNSAITGVLLTVVLAGAVAGCGNAETRKARYLERGQQYFAQHHYQKAGVEFRNALQIDPNFLRARVELGRVAEKLGNVGAALGQYQAVMDADPNDVLAHVLAGRLYVLGGLPQKALDLVTPGLARDQDNAQLLTVRGAARAALGDRTGALADAEAAFKKAPDDEYTVALLASLRQSGGQVDEAVHLVRDAIARHPENSSLRDVLVTLLVQQGDFTAAEEQLQDLVRREPELLEHRYALARFYLGRGDPAAAERTLRAAVGAAPSDDEPKLALVSFLAAQRGTAAAEKELSDYIGRDPRNFQFRLLLAGYQAQNGQSSEAQQSYRSIINDAGRDPARFEASDRLAALLVRSGQSAEASRLVDAVLKENPNDNEALRLRARLAYDRGDARAAIVDLRAALRDQPNSVPIMRALASAYVANKEPALGEETLRNALQASPKDPAIRVQLAALLEQTGRVADARALLAQAVADAPTSLAADESLIHVEAEQKDYAGARATAAGMARSQPTLGVGNYLLGLMDEADSNPDAAVHDYQAALSAEPQSVEPLVALVRLEVSHGRGTQALQLLDDTIARAPANPVAHNLRGQVLESMGRFDQATQAYEAASVHAPDWWVPYQNLARCALLRHDTPGATAALERGVTQTNGNLLLAGKLAAVYEMQGAPEKAIQLYEHLLKTNPDSSTAASNLAMLLVTYRTDTASLERAQSLATTLGKANDAAFTDTRGWVMFKSGNYQQALPLLTAAAAHDPESMLKRYHLGMVQLRTGDREAARKNIELAVDSKRPFLGQQDAKNVLVDLKHDG